MSAERAGTPGEALVARWRERWVFEPPFPIAPEMARDIDAAIREAGGTPEVEPAPPKPRAFTLAHLEASMLLDAYTEGSEHARRWNELSKAERASWLNVVKRTRSMRDEARIEQMEVDQAYWRDEMARLRAARPERAVVEPLLEAFEDAVREHQMETGDHDYREGARQAMEAKREDLLDAVCGTAPGPEGGGENAEGSVEGHAKRARGNQGQEDRGISREVAASRGPTPVESPLAEPPPAGVESGLSATPPLSRPEGAPAAPAGQHDERCEAEWIDGAKGYTSCGCADRRASAPAAPVDRPSSPTRPWVGLRPRASGASAGGGGAERPTLAPLSREERDARRPVHPAIAIDARHDNIHKDAEGGGSAPAPARQEDPRD